MSSGEVQAEYLRKVEWRLGKKIHCLLEKLRTDELFGSGGQAVYEESLLTHEVKKYFETFVLQEDKETEKELSGRNPVSGGNIPLFRAYEAFALDDFEKMCVELAVLGEINPYFEKFYIYMNNDWNSGYLTADTAVKLYAPECEGTAALEFCQYFTEGSRLMIYFLKAVKQEGKSRVRWGLSCRTALYDFLFAGETLRTDVGFFMRCQKAGGESCHYPDKPLFDRLDIIREGTRTAQAAGAADETGAVIYLPASDESGTELAGSYAGNRGYAICFLNMRRFAYLLDKNRLEEDFTDICRGICLKLAAEKGWLCLHGLDEDFLGTEQNRQLMAYVLRLFRGQTALLFITGGEHILGADDAQGVWTFSMENSGTEKQRPGSLAFWQCQAERYQLDSQADLEVFASAYSFTRPQISRILERADRRRLLEGACCIRREDLKESCICETCGEGNSLVTSMDTECQWDDLVLPEKQKNQLQIAYSRILYRERVYREWGFGRKMTYGKGVSMLFSGPPGTGKTMAAGIIANQLGKTLYRIDLSAVASKYIGETEKNLNMVFDTGQKGQGVLFFDEADVLFGRRSEIGNSNDKHSNMEAAYLLQKMEEYEGIVILATNYMQNIDDAFKRRISFRINFLLPDMEHRKILWQKAFPEQARLDEAPDYDFLARQFELSGSQIKNIALQAAFFAAEAEKGIGMKEIVKALLIEFDKTGKRVTQKDLQEYYHYYE